MDPLAPIHIAQGVKIMPNNNIFGTAHLPPQACNKHICEPIFFYLGPGAPSSVLRGLGWLASHWEPCSERRAVRAQCTSEPFVPRLCLKEGGGGGGTQGAGGAGGWPCFLTLLGQTS